MNEPIHVPVMLREVLSHLSAVRDPQCVVDATLGLGGHTEAILQASDATKVLGIDQDASARAFAQERLAPFGERFRAVAGNFEEIGDIVRCEGIQAIDGVLFDLGVSNLQLASPERGFSHNADACLDMRMDPERDDRPFAKDILSDWDLRSLSTLFREYGEEPFAHAIAKAIVRSRERGDGIETTEQLVALVRRTIPAPAQRKMKGHPARRVFQALRIAVNDEMGALERVLEQLPRMGELRRNPGCVVVFIAYHSLEDRRVKRAFLQWKAEGHGVVLTRRPLSPQVEEIEENKKARSAKLRAFVFADPEAREALERRSPV